MYIPRTWFLLFYFVLFSSAAIYFLTRAFFHVRMSTCNCVFCRKNLGIVTTLILMLFAVLQGVFAALVLGFLLRR